MQVVIAVVMAVAVLAFTVFCVVDAFKKTRVIS